MNWSYVNIFIISWDIQGAFRSQMRSHGDKTINDPLMVVVMETRW